MLKSSNEWDKIYTQDCEGLPWFNLPFSRKLLSLLNNLEKEKKLIVTGCGAGETLNRINKLGFKHLKGYDLSENAIKMARKRFPLLNFSVSKTEAIEEVDCNIFDQYVLHHIPESSLKRYVHSLDRLGDKIICVFFYDKKQKRESIIKRKSKVYHHNPHEVERLFSRHLLVKKAIYQVKPNTPDKKLKYTAIAQYYERK